MNAELKQIIELYGIKVASKITGKDEPSLRYLCKKLNINIPSNDELMSNVANLLERLNNKG